MAEIVASVAPSRPTRQPAGSSINLTDKIIALQRKNANAPGPARASGRRAEADEFSRGGERQANRTLYDPSRPAPRPVSRDEEPERRTNQAFLAPAISVSLSSGRERSARSATPSPNGLRDPFQSRDSGREPPRSPRSDRRNERDSSSTTKKLFNPDVHDPHHFSSSRTPSVVARNLHLGSDTSSVRPVIRRPAQTPLTPDEEADRERERRKRREGSERGSLSVKKKDGDARSRGSRSSDGSESLKDRERGKGKADSGVKAILKDIHNKIRVLETDLTEMHKKMSADPEAGIAVIMEPRKKTEADETAAWIDLIGRHKELADLHQLFLVRVFDPMIPSTFQQLAVKYNIPSRLWQVSFHLILERLRHAWMTSSPHALDLLTDLVYDAYKFYTDLLEDQALGNFRTAWIEALGDLARYRMAIASFVGETSDQGASRQDQTPLETAPSDVPRDFDAMSIGAEVAQSWDVEDKETWRTTAVDWYSMGITEKPGEGRLHHHLALLCRDVRGQEGRALHHFVKSLVVTHSYITSRESLLPLFDTALQSQRSLPDANAMDLFVRLHGMLFTRIDLDNFDEVLSRFMERLEEDAKVEAQTHRGPISQVDWITMASANLGAILQYGASGGVIRKALSMEGAERRRAVAHDGEVQDDDEEEREASPTPEERAPVEETLELPAMVTQALRLTVAILEHCFAHPTRQQGIHSVLNPYIALVLTFFGTVFKQQQVATLLSPYIPWQSLVVFVDQLSGEVKEESKLAVGPPLPEDWTVRGMEWVGRRVFERGFWKLKSNSRDGRGSGGLAQPRHGPSGSGEGERFASEMDVLLNNFENTLDISEGVVEEGENEVDGAVNVNHRRLRRVFWVIGLLVKHVEGLELREGKVFIESPLKEQLEEVEKKKQAEAAERERELKSRYKKEDGEERRNPVRRTSLKLVPGYTMLVFDTNVLLSSLSLFASLVESRKWSIIIPLPVITELDGLSKNVGTDLSVSAVAAISYLEQKIKSHSLHLKIQTSKGNYLNDLLIRTEMVNFKDPELTSRNMDDLILNIATFQLDQFAEKADVAGGARVLLVTYDRNLRVRSRARGIDAADEKEVSAALSEV